MVFNINLFVQVLCKKCGAELESKQIIERGNRVKIQVEPCKDCIEQAEADENERNRHIGR